MQSSASEKRAPLGCRLEELRHVIISSATLMRTFIDSGVLISAAKPVGKSARRYSRLACQHLNRSGEAARL